MFDWLNWEKESDDVAARLANDLLSEIPLQGRQRVDFWAVCTTLPFYTHHKLYRLGGKDRETGLALPAECYALWDDAGEAVLLNGNSEPVHYVNRTDPIHLTPDNVADYLRLFLFAIRSDEGAFNPLEVPPDEGTPGYEIVAPHARPIQQTKPDEEGRYRLVATILYARNIFTAPFAVTKDGYVEMLDDEHLAEEVPEEAIPPVPKLNGFEVLMQHLFVPGVPQSEPRMAGSMPIKEKSTSKESVSPGQDTHGENKGSTRSAFLILMELLLGRALGQKNEHRLIVNFNATQPGGSPLDQFARMMVNASPIVAVETHVPFVEEAIWQIIYERSNSRTPISTFRAQAAEDIVTYSIPSVEIDYGLVLLPLQTYRRVANLERLAFDLATRNFAAIIACDTFEQIPESLRAITDITLKLPPLDTEIFEIWFKRVLGMPPPAEWKQKGEAWVKYAAHTDFEHPKRMQLSREQAFDYIHGQVTERMIAIDPNDGLGLKELYGLGEARQFAEDLISDIHAAIKGELPWSQVDRGALLVGPPGTGKTTLARAIAKDCNVKFITASAAAWQAAGFLNDHILAIRKTFSEARRYAPSILFLDEIDSLGSRENFKGSNAEYQTAVVNAVLEQIQGLDEEAPVFVLGATNNENGVDSALKRSGRMDRVIRIPRPNSEALDQIYRHYLGRLAAGIIDSQIDTDGLGKLSVGLTGADVERIVRGAARRARKNRRPLSQHDLIAEITDKPRDVGNSHRLTESELERTAYHEAGHTLAMWMSDSQRSNIGFVTIIPRDNGTLGFVASLPDERVSLTRQDYLEKIELFLAGRAAEAIRYGEENVSGGAASDLRAATELAVDMVTRLGLGETRRLLWAENPTHIDLDEAEKILQQSLGRIAAKLKDGEASLKRLAEMLMARQELTGEEVRKILSK